MSDTLVAGPMNPVILQPETYELLRAEAIQLHLATWNSERHVPEEWRLRRDGWGAAICSVALRSAERLVELGAFERHPDSRYVFRAIPTAANPSEGGGACSS